MANPTLPGITAEEQAVLYEKLNLYNRGRASYKEAGAYLLVLPHDGLPDYSLWIYAPLPERQTIFFLCNLAPGVHEALRMASTLCFYSVRCLVVVEYNSKRMQNRGDDLVGFGKYRGHYLHEVLRIDPAYLSWLAFKFQPRTPKQERFALIAKVYHAVGLDIQRQKSRARTTAGRFLGKEGEKVENLTLTVVQVRVEDNPFRTEVKGTVPYFYVRQLLTLKDAAGNLVTLRLNARTPSHESGRLPAAEHAYRPGELVQVATARVARTYTYGGRNYTQLSHARLQPFSTNTVA